MKQLIQKKEYIENGTVSYRTYSLSLNSGDHDNSEEKKGRYQQFESVTIVRSIYGDRILRGEAMENLQRQQITLKIEKILHAWHVTPSAAKQFCTQFTLFMYVGVYVR